MIFIKEKHFDAHARQIGSLFTLEHPRHEICRVYGCQRGRQTSIGVPLTSGLVYSDDCFSLTLLGKEVNIYIYIDIIYSKSMGVYWDLLGLVG